MSTTTAPPAATGLIRELGLVDSVMIVAGSMIGSAVFIVAADITRQVGSAGWMLMVWLVTGVITLVGALAYGELAAMLPRAGGQYIYLTEAYSPLWGFLYGWTLFVVIQTGSLAAIVVAFSRFAGVLVPAISPTSWIVPPINITHDYALSLSTQQLAAILVLALLTYLNTRGLRLGKWIQNVFTTAKTLALVILILLGIFVAARADVVAANFANAWQPQGVSPIRPELSFLPTVSAEAGGIGLLIAFLVAMVGSLAAADSWFTITYVAGEVKNPRRNIPLALVIGAGMVIVLYFLANLAYLFTLPISEIQHAPDDRVATAALGTMFGGAGATMMAVAIMVSTFGCANSYTLAGARVYHAMAQDGLFFRAAGRLNHAHVPAVALVLPGLWACALVLPRTRLYDSSGAALVDASGAVLYGNVYSNLLDYVVFSFLIFYVLTMAAVFVLRRKRPDLERPYHALGYPVLPAIYIVVTAAIALTLLAYKTNTTWPGLVLVLSGIPVYALWRRAARY
jgi:APA family basic amino acid/polyamine antiporter